MPNQPLLEHSFRIDPLICGVSLIVSCPLIVYAVVTAKVVLIVIARLVAHHNLDHGFHAN